MYSAISCNEMQMKHMDTFEIICNVWSLIIINKHPNKTV